MTNIDDSAQTPHAQTPHAQTPPGYWFGVIEERLHERMRSALSDLGLRRGSWRILHTLADGPATTAELADRLPHGDRRDHEHHGDHDGRDGSGRPDEKNRGEWGGFRHGFRPGWRGQEPRDERPAGPDHEHSHAGADGHDEHDHASHHGPHHGFERAFERGYERGFDRGFAFGTVRGGLPFPPAFGPGFGGHPHYGPYPGGAPFGAAFPGGAPFDRRGHGRRPFGHDGRRGHRIDRTLGDFVERGWVWFDGDRATLTDEGRAAHDAAFERVRSVRTELANGIPEGDYATTLATLETMARNLGWRPAGPEETPDDAPSMDA